MIEFLFLDLDDTILDFKKAEKLAIRKTIASFGAEVTDEILARYHVINKAHWEICIIFEISAPLSDRP